MPVNIFIYVTKAAENPAAFDVYYAISDSSSGSMNMLNVPLNSPFISNLMSRLLYSFYGIAF